MLFASSTILVFYSILYPSFLLSSPPTIVGKNYDEIIAFSPSLAAFLKVAAAFVALAILGLGIFGMAVSRISYRNGERWAWYVLWYLVIFTVASTIVDFTISGSTAYTFIIVAIVATLGQLVSYRNFFQKQS